MKSLRNQCHGQHRAIKFMAAEENAILIQNFSLNLGRIYEITTQENLSINQLSPKWESPDRRSPFDVYWSNWFFDMHVKLFLHVSLAKKGISRCSGWLHLFKYQYLIENTVADLHRQILDSPAVKFPHLMQFLGIFNLRIGWRSRPPLRKFWFRHWDVLNIEMNQIATQAKIKVSFKCERSFTLNCYYKRLVNSAYRFYAECTCLMFRPLLSVTYLRFHKN